MSATSTVVRQLRDSLPGARALPPLAELWADHRAAIAEFSQLAEGVDVRRWLAPRAEGKWTPAQEVSHVALFYETFRRDLDGEQTMRLKGNWFQRRLWRLAALSRIMRGGSLPFGVKAPREVRPPEETASVEELVARLHDKVGRFEQAMERTFSERPDYHLTHAYLGNLTLEQGLRMSAVHTRHHAPNLAAVQSTVQ